MQMAAEGAAAARATAPRRCRAGPARAGLAAALAIAIAAALPGASAVHVEAQPPHPQRERRNLREPTLLEAGAKRRAAAPAPAPAAEAPAPHVYNLMTRAMLPEDYVRLGLPPPSEQSSSFDPPWPMIGPALPSYPWVKRTPCDRAKGKEEKKGKDSELGDKVLQAADVLAAAKSHAAALSAARGPSPAPAGAPAASPGAAPAPAPEPPVLAVPLDLGPFPGGEGALFNPLGVAQLAMKVAEDKTQEKFMKDSSRITDEAIHMNAALGGRLQDLSKEINKQSVDYWYALNNRTWLTNPNPLPLPHGALYPRRVPR